MQSVMPIVLLTAAYLLMPIPLSYCQASRLFSIPYTRYFTQPQWRSFDVSVGKGREGGACGQGHTNAENGKGGGINGAVPSLLPPPSTPAKKILATSLPTRYRLEPSFKYRAPAGASPSGQHQNVREARGFSVSM